MTDLPKRLTSATFLKRPRWGSMFFFFSNRIGCLGSLIISVVLTLVVLSVLGVF
ncbi:MULTISPECIES: hypothetical protein [Chelativorans]|jgi:hypothetical protein|uniref:hypothetical protein n=1 Tax=Chelativorans TaxID=449972 RepID=UPI00003A2BB0|nr:MULTISPECIES: hypothetical protein [Chelativorans]